MFRGVSDLKLTLVGAYNKTYPRNDVVFTGLRELGVEFEERHVSWGSPWQRKRRLKKLLAKLPLTSPFAYVPAFGHHEVGVLRKFFNGTIIFDPLVSRYMTKIQDYKKAGKYSIHALTNHLVDNRSLTRADIVLTDTLCHKKYFEKKYHTPSTKMFPMYVGVNTNDFFPQTLSRQNVSEITVGFYGSFIPLHGIENIVATAALFRNDERIRFEIVGKGYTFNAITKQIAKLRLTNIKLLGKKEYSELPGYINSWDICLGIFGDTLKAQIVIPNKVFHYCACKKPVITQDCPAIHEIFTHGKNIHLTKNDPHEMKNAILALVEDNDYRCRLSENAYSLISGNYSHKDIAKRLIEIVQSFDTGMKK